MRDAIGRAWQMSTIQLDFNLPQLFELEYQGSDGDRHRPVMIHRALFGSIERFVGRPDGALCGAFPAWLAPVQVVLIPITRPAGAVPPGASQQSSPIVASRAEVDESDDRMQKRSAPHNGRRCRFMLIAGATDEEAGAVSFRYRDGEQRNGVDASTRRSRRSVEFIARRVNPSPTAADFS